MSARPARRPGPVGRAAGVLAAAVALLLAASPWLGTWLAPVDAVAPAWPLAAPLAVAVLALWHARSGAAAIALLALALCVPTLLAQPRPAVAVGTPFRVVTHNVWIDNAAPARTAAVLAASGADVLLLQETNGRFAAMLPVLARTFPYANRCRHGCPLAILSRHPIDRVRYRFRDAGGRPVGPDLIRTRVHLPGGLVVPIATLHLPRGLPAEADRRQRAALAAAIPRAEARALILAGDFNLVPWSARLAWLDAALAPLRRTTAAFSWPARLGGRAFPLPLVPIDHLYAGADWTMASVQRLPQTGSDHYPIAVDLIWQGPAAMVTDADRPAGDAGDRDGDPDA